MPFAQLADPTRVGIYLLLGAMIAIYVATRATVGALSPRGMEPKPGWRAIGQWLIIAMAAIIATVRSHPEIAIGIIFATSIGSLSLIWGVVLFQNPLPEAPAKWRRTWPFVLPVTVLPLMAGFTSILTFTHATIMFVEGMALFLLWIDPSSPTENSPPVVPIAEPSETQHRKFSIGAFNWLQLALGLILGAIGAWAAVQANIEIGRSSRIMTSGLVAATMLSPLLILPMISMGAALGQRGQPWVATTTSVAVALLNLCLLLPIVVSIHYTMPVWKPAMQTALADVFPNEEKATTQPATAPIVQNAATQPTVDSSFEEIEHSNPFPYPLPVWRVDTVFLLVIGMFLVPIGLGRWAPGRLEAMALVLGYVIYLFAATIAGARY